MCPSFLALTVLVQQVDKTAHGNDQCLLNTDEPVNLKTNSEKKS